MAIAPPDEDVVTMGASAAQPLLDMTDPQRIEWVLFATETGVDQSKAAALFVHGLLDLPVRCRAVEMKEACYGGTAALRLAVEWARNHPRRQALVIASDIARYDLRSPGEPTQGAGAVAMLVGSDPRLVALDEEAGLYTEDVMDFWRPNYRNAALVDGQYSTRVYLSALEQAWRHYVEVSGRGWNEFSRFCYHLPFTRIAEKAQSRLARIAGVPAPGPEGIHRLVEETLRYNRLTGNTYAASLYEGLTSLLDHAEEDLGGRRIAFYSYGSGCAAEFFSGTVMPGYREHVRGKRHREMLESRTALAYQQYEDIMNLPFPTDGGDHVFAQYRTGPYRLAGLSQHKRIYETL
jgi:hydroxymethylglutaryl-CoA synthase